MDELIALRTQDVTTQYIKDIRATGLKPSVDQVIALKVQGVTPAYVKQVRDMGFDANVDEIINFKVQDISPEFVKEVRDMGFNAGADAHRRDEDPGCLARVRQADERAGPQARRRRPHRLPRARHHARVREADARQRLQRGHRRNIALRVHDVTPEYRKKLESAGYKLSTDQLIQAKVMDITPEFVSKAASHGFKNLNLDQLIALKNADVL